MKAEQTNSMLHQYLSLQTKEEPKPERVKKKKEVSTHKLTETNQEEVALSRIVNQIESFNNKVNSKLAALTPDEFSVLRGLVQHSACTPVILTALLSNLSDKLGLGQFYLKTIVVSLQRYKMVEVINHKWKGRLIRVAPLWRQYILGLMERQFRQPNLADCQLLSESPIQQLEKQLLFIFYHMKQSELQLNNQNKLHKAVIQELRETILGYNPLFTLLEDPMFQSTKSVEQQRFNHFIDECDDAVVRFILEIAFQLQCMSIEKTGFVWHEQRWLEWLAVDECIKQQTLKFLVAEYVAERANNDEYSYLFNWLLAVPDKWELIENVNTKENQIILYLSYSCGWINIVSERHHYFARQKPVYFANRELLLLQNLQILCFQDCKSQSVWDVLHIAQIDQLQELLVCHVNPSSLIRAYQNGYTFECIKQIMTLQHFPQWQGQWERINMLASQQGQRGTNDVSHNNCCHKVVIENSLLPLNSQSSLNYAVGIAEKSDDHLLKEEVQSVLLMTKKYPDVWFSKLKSYNASVFKEIISLAGQIGLEFELQTEDKVFRVIASYSAESLKEEVISMRVVSKSMETDEQRELKLNISQIKKVRLIREY